MTTPSKLGVAFLSLFGLPFLGVGLFAAYSFLNTPNQPLSTRIGAAVFAPVFAIIGGGLIFGSFYGYSLQKKQFEMQQAQPASPWLWREDWAAGRAESKKAKVLGWWIGAVLLNMLSLPFVVGTFDQAIETRNPSYIVPFIFGLMGLLVFVGAIRATIRRERFGKTYFELASLPFAPGGRMAGSIHLQMNSDAAHGVDLKLTCFRRVVTSAGKNRASQQVPLWEASKNVPAAAFQRGPMDTAIPVEFHLPAEAFQTSHDSLDDQVFWQLNASADVPGVDYSDEFEVPVFRGGATATSFGTANAFAGATETNGFSASRIPEELSEEVAEPARHKVMVEDSPGGLEFRFRPARNIGRTLLVVVLAVAVSALFYGMLTSKARTPFFAYGVVGFLDFFLILAVIHTALTATRITVGNGQISWKKSILGIGGTHQLQISEVDSIAAVTSIQQASSSGSTLYSLRLRSKAGRVLTMVDEIESREEARWIVAKIEKRAGLRASTQVEVLDSPFYGPPPQPGSAPTRRSLVSR
ncbi:MAG TPA: hypothetical protein VGD60_10835 [Candidatus Acidoferrales bacterium]